MAASADDEACRRLRVAALLAATALSKGTFDPTRAVAIISGIVSVNDSLQLEPGNVPAATIWVDLGYALTLRAAQVGDPGFFAAAGDVTVLGDPAVLIAGYTGPALPAPSPQQLSAAFRAVQIATTAIAPGAYTAGVPLSVADANALGAGRVAAAFVYQPEALGGVPPGQPPALFAVNQGFANGLGVSTTTPSPATIDATEALGAAVADVLANTASLSVTLQVVDERGTSLESLTANLDLDRVLRTTSPALDSDSASTSSLLLRVLRDYSSFTLLSIQALVSPTTKPSASVLYVTPDVRLGGPLPAA